MAGNRIPMVRVSVLLVFLAMYLSTGASKRTLATNPNQCALELPHCKTYGKHINVKIIARNDLVEPNFEEEVTISSQPQSPLIYFLEQAAELNGAFNFSATYYPTLGYFIDTINGVRGFKENKTFWHIISVDRLGSLECGSSSFIPINNDIILFNFTTWAQAGFDY
ncbi:unnamed protein product [Candidula unifasciata]|uniref:DUF4430 domain-containing protein n=1 Tax=Candidula unifasciata TaxID=100452 RepID=A0A8S3YES6_9EUPU|nr:unnamed protein product [Candidula unifasciata]